MCAYTFITGATGGIGLEFARIFAKEKHSLVLVARNGERLGEIKTSLEADYGIRVETIACDLADDNAVEQIFRYTEEKGWQVDILINNVGFGDHNCYFDTAWERQKNMIDINITALAQLTYLYGAKMRENRRGRILNVASVAAFCAGPYMSVYYASKSFVLSFSEALSEELSPYGVTVSVLCPGPVNTAFEKNAGLEDSKMFKILRVSDPASVARAGYRGLMKGKALVYCGPITKLGNVCFRLLPRALSRKLTKYINVAKEDGKRKI